MPKILVVGAGLTGAVAAWKLQKALAHDVEIECWEYLNDAGGRLGTTREEGIVADVATQYLSFDLQRTGVKELHAELARAGLLSEVDESILSKTAERPSGAQWKHFFVPAGTSAVVNFLLKAAKTTVKTNCMVDWCSVDAENWQWFVEASGGKGGGARRKDSFDAIVLCNGPTHPGCERMDNIWGEWQDVIASSFWSALREVTWSSCYVVTLFLKPQCADQCEKFFGANVVQKTVNDDLVHYVTYESRKRSVLLGKCSSRVVLVCHTTAEAMWHYKRAQCVQAVQERVLSDYLKLPAAQAGRMVCRTHSRCWGKCQVTQSISDVLNKETSYVASSAFDAPPLALCGDYFSGLTCTDAVVSAICAADAIASQWLVGVQHTAMNKNGYYDEHLPVEETSHKTYTQWTSSDPEQRLVQQDAKHQHASKRRWQKRAAA